MSKEEYTPLSGHFFLRDRHGGRIMMIGVLENSDIKLEGAGEVWLIDFMILNKKRYKEPIYFKGKRADQVLCTPLRMEDLEEIKE